MRIDKEWLEVNLVDIQNRLKNKYNTSKNKLKKCITMEEIKDIDYLFASDFSEKSIIEILGTTTNDDIYMVLMHLEEAV